MIANHGVLPTSWGEAHHRHRAPSRASLVVSVISAVVMGVFAALQLDPLLEIFGPTGGIGIAGLAALWLLTAIAVAVLFPRKGGSQSTVMVAVLAVVEQAAILFLILSNLATIVGGTTLLAVLMGLVPRGVLHRRIPGELPCHRSRDGDRQDRAIGQSAGSESENLTAHQHNTPGRSNR